jgi:hypothetical protein
MTNAPRTEYSPHPETFKYFKAALNAARDLMNDSEMMELADDLHEQIRERRSFNSTR